MKKTFLYVLAGLWLLTLLSTISLDGDFSMLAAQINTPPPAAEEGVGFGPQKTVQEVYMSIAVLVFGLFIIIAMTFLFYKQKADVEDSLKYFVVTLIIIGSLFLVTAGYGNQQIAPILGLLGTIAGYLLGKAFDGGSKRTN